MEFSESVSVTCNICFTRQVSVVKAMKGCDHPNESCETCLFAMIESKIQSGLGAMKGVFCPNVQCARVLDPDELLSIVAERDKELANSYCDQLFRNAITQMPEFVWCAHNCGSGQLNDGGAENTGQMPALPAQNMFPPPYPVP